MAADGTRSSKRNMIPMILMGVWLVALTILLVTMFMKTPKQTASSTAGKKAAKGKILPRGAMPATASGDVEAVSREVRSLDRRMKTVENKLAKLDTIDEKITLMENQGQALEALMAKLEGLEASISSFHGISAPVRPASDDKATTAGVETTVTATEPKRSTSEKKTPPSDTATTKAAPDKPAVTKTTASTRKITPPAAKTAPIPVKRRKPVVKKRVVRKTEYKPRTRKAGPPIPQKTAGPVAVPPEDALPQGLSGSLHQISLKYAPSYSLDTDKRRRLRKMAPGIAVYPGKNLLVPGDPPKVGGMGAWTGTKKDNLM